MADGSPVEAKLPPPWVLLLVALGLPAAAVGQLSDWALARPWSALGLLAAWWVLVGVGGFALKVWAKREPAVLAWFDERIDQLWLRLFSRSGRAYLGFVADKSLRLRREGLVSRRGWSFRLEEVFVDLRLVPRAEGEAGTGIVPQGQEAPLRGRHSLWALLDRDPDQPLRLVVLGGPGTGKSTLLEHVALRLATGRGRPIPHRLRRRAPILIALRSHAARVVEKPDTSLPALVEGELPATVRPVRVASWLGQQLDRGRAIVMIDGLDEVADPAARRQVVTWVGRQMRAYPRCAFILTSRRGGYRDNPLEAVDLEAEVERFTAPQVRQFAQQWFLADTWREERLLHADPAGKLSEAALAQRVRARAPARAEEFLGRLRSLPALGDFTGNPLLLLMMAEVHAAGGTLGQRRAELYDEMMKIALGRRREAKGLALDLGIEQKLAVAQPLALAMLERESPVLPASDAADLVRVPLMQVRPEMRPEDFLHGLEHDAGILVQREAGAYAFAHLTYQEYLAARQLGPGGAATLVPRLAVPAWQETVLFWSALHDASPIVATLLREPAPTARDLELALRIKEEAKELGVGLRDRLSALIEGGRESRDPVVRTVVATALLARRLASLQPVSEAVAIDDGLVTHAEYQLFLDERRAGGEWRQPDHWVEPVFPSGSGRLPMAGVRPSDAVAFCAWLTERQGGGARFRLPTFAEAQQHALAEKARVYGVAYWIFDASARRTDDEGWEPACFDLVDAPLTTVIRVAEQLSRTSLSPNLMSTNVLSRIDLDHRALDRDLDRALDLARGLDRDLAIDRDLALGRALALALAYDRPRARDLARDLGLDRDLARDLGLYDSSRGALPATAAGTTEAGSVLADTRARRRVYAFLVVISGTWSLLVGHTSGSERRTGLPALPARLLWLFRSGTNFERHRGRAREQLANLFGRLCAACLLVLHRVGGNAEPYEGIRLVREWVTGEASDTR